jgi:hypothetical protein
MSAPRKACNLQTVKIRPMQRLATSIELISTVGMVTDSLKLLGGTYQAATQVKGLSPEIFNVVEADVFHDNGKQHRNDEMASHILLCRGLRPWHGMKWKVHELGRSALFPQGYDGASCTRQGLLNDRAEVGLADSTRSMGKPYTWESGQQGRDRSSKALINTQRLGY